MRPLLSLVLLLGLASSATAAPPPAAAGGASGHARDGSTQAPRLWIMQNLSHYIVAGEIGGNLKPEADRQFELVMQRAAMLDGRVSNGEQVQVDMGPVGQLHGAAPAAGP